MRKLFAKSTFAAGWVVIGMLLTLTACTRKSDSSGSATTADPAAQMRQLATRGRSIYMSQCISCHNPIASKDGSVGPALAGSSRELIEARLLRAEYPAGYVPKRQSKVMPAMPYLKNEIEALHAFLNAPAEG